MAIGAWKQGTSTKYFAFDGEPVAAAQGGTTELSGSWDTQSNMEAKEFNGGIADPRETIRITLNASTKYANVTNKTNGASMRSTFYITLFGSTSGTTGTFVSQGTTHTFSVGSTDSATFPSPTTKNFIFNNYYQYWYIRAQIINGGYFTTQQGSIMDAYIRVDNMRRTSYKTKAMMHGAGLQVMTGPEQYVRLGRNQNLIYGDFQVSGSAEAGGTGYFTKNLTVGDDEANTSYPMYVVGDMAATGNIIAYVASDERLKDHISPLENSLDKLKKLNAVDFLWKDQSKGWGKKTPQDIGLIAQEVEKEFPSLVGEMADGYKGIRYDRLVPVLVDSIKTQDKKIDDLQVLVEKLVKKIQE
jgi:hypothetical protein